MLSSPACGPWSEVLARLPAGLDLDALARGTRAIQRRRAAGTGDGATLLRLSLAHGPGGKSLPETAAWARQNHLAGITGQSLNERLHRAAGFLAAVTRRLLAGRSAGQGCSAGQAGSAGQAAWAGGTPSSGRAGRRWPGAAPTAGRPT